MKLSAQSKSKIPHALSNNYLIKKSRNTDQSIVRVMARRSLQKLAPPSRPAAAQIPRTSGYPITNPPFTQPSLSTADAVLTSFALTPRARPIIASIISNLDFLELARKSQEFLQIFNAMVGTLTSSNGG